MVVKIRFFFSLTAFYLNSIEKYFLKIRLLPFFFAFYSNFALNRFYINIKSMGKIYFEEKNFEKTDFSKNALPQGNYENCTFRNCIFAKADLMQINFSDCVFSDCDLSLAKIAHTAFKNVAFKDCKLLGLNFEHCNDFLFSVNFDRCNLNFSTLYKLKLKNTMFKNCSLQETDFSETDLTAAVFDNCDLLKAVFDNTILEKADLSTAYNYAIDPEKNRLKNAKFSRDGLHGLLWRYGIEVV